MSDLVLDGLLVVLALFLVALNGLFVAAEFGLVKIRSTQVDGLVREGRRSSGKSVTCLSSLPSGALVYRSTSCGRKVSL